MQRDPEWVAEVSEWLGKSNDDRRASRILLDADSSLAGVALYHCQQAAEKALKGFLVWHGQIIRKTHDLEQIGMEVTAIDPTMAPFVEAAVPLSTFAWLVRYPGSDVVPDEGMIDQGMQAAVAIFTAIRQRIFP